MLLLVLLTVSTLLLLPLLRRLLLHFKTSRPIAVLKPTQQLSLLLFQPIHLLP
jgi:hypothetical protein